MQTNNSFQHAQGSADIMHNYDTSQMGFNLGVLC